MGKHSNMEEKEVSFRTCTMTGLSPRIVDYKTDSDFIKEANSLKRVKKALEKKLAGLDDREDRVRAIFEVYTWALPFFGKEKLMGIFTEFMLEEIPGPSLVDYGQIQYSKEPYEKNGMTWYNWNKYPEYQDENQKYYCV